MDVEIAREITVGESERVPAEWLRRLGCWYSAIKVPFSLSRSQLGSCIGALGLHAAGRLGHGSVPSGCEWLSEGTRLQLPEDAAGAATQFQHWIQR